MLGRRSAASLPALPNSVLSALPDIHPLIRRANHRRAIRNIEGFLEFHEVRKRPDRPETPGRMWIRIEPQLQILVALIVSPDLGEPKEEALFRSEPIDLRLRAFLGDRLLQRRERQLHA